jgi:hypothetical protein
MAENTSEDLTASGASVVVTSVPAVAAVSARGPHAPPPEVLFVQMFWESLGALGVDVTETDALKILLQASAAAESLQLRFSELNQRRAELSSDQKQLELERWTFEQRAQEFATEVARSRAEYRELLADLERRLGGEAGEAA